MTGKPATDFNEDNIKRLLQGYYVPEKKINQLLGRYEPVLLVAVIEWLRNITPGFKNYQIMERIVLIVREHEHFENVIYLEQNKLIPRVPPGVLERQEIEQFFAVARDILNCEHEHAERFSLPPTPPPQM